MEWWLQKVSVFIKYTKKIHQFFLGSKAEMETLEDKYVSGSWRPSFLSPPPKRRKKSNKQVAKKG